MNKTVLLMFVLVLVSVSFVSADTCQTDEVLDGLRKALYIHYTTPSESSMTVEDLTGLLSFYVGIGTGQATADCNSEEKSKVDQAKVLPDRIPICSDGTKYGKCSDNKPMYCYAGRLVPRCRLCECPEGDYCDETYVYEEKGNKGRWGKCYLSENVTCSDGTEYGLCSTIKPQYCDNGTLIDNCQACGCDTGICQVNGTCTSGCDDIRITTNPTYHREPIIYGNKIAWHDKRNGNYDIYMYDISTGQETQITTDPTDQRVPDIYEDKIVWIDKRNGNLDVYMYDLSTGQETQITNAPETQGAADIYGDIIVWGDNRDWDHDIYMYDLSTGQETQITDDASVQQASDIYGDKIVWADRRNGDYDIYMYDISTGQETQITTATADQHYPDIYGDKIVWADMRNGNYDTYMYDISTGQETQITTDTASQLTTKIHANKIVWEDHKNGNWDIYMYDISTGQETQITTNTRDQYYPTIYGDKIAWTDNRNGKEDIYMTTIC